MARGASGSDQDIATFPEQLKRLLSERFALGPPVDEPVLYLLDRPGKSLRPALCYAVADACGHGPERALLAVAAGGELVHLASLIHDDVVDEAERRRGAPALHRRFDARTAVLAGDYLLSAGYAVVAADAAEATLRKLAEAVQQLAAAELNEFRHRGVVDDVDLARRIAQGKGGTLFAWIASGAAVECREWAGENAWHSWGMDLGLLYQLADDMGDLLPEDTGKDVGRDAATGTPSFATALLRADASGDGIAWELETLTYAVERPPASGTRLQRLVGQIVDLAHERFEALMARAEGGRPEAE